MYKKMFAFLLALTLVLSGFNINAESVLADEAATLTDVSITRPEPVPATGGKKAFKLKGSNIKLKDTKAKVTLKGSAEDIADISSTLASVIPDLNEDELRSSINLNLMFPANSEAEDKVYVVSFSVDGGKTFYDKKKDAHESNLSAEPVEIMVKGKYEETTIGTPQGGNLSPLLSNIMLNELDKELEARGLHFVRYADDCIITVASSAAANRVMHSVTSWIERKLSLKVNATKSKVTKPTRLKYLGFGFVKMNGKWEARPHKDSINRFKRKLKKLTYRSWSVSMDYRILRLNQVIRGWINYFRIAKMKQNMTKIDEHLRNRMRIVIWKQWKTSKKRMWGLRKLGVPEWMARQSVGFTDHYQAVARTAGLRKITKEILAKRGLISCLDYYLN